MSGMTNENAIIYRVNGLQYNSLKSAQTATKSVTDEIAKGFEKTAQSISQFANYLATNPDNYQSVDFFKSMVLGLTETDCKDSAKVFSAIRANYPYKNEKGNMVKSVCVSKGIFKTEIISVFEKSIIDEIQMRWLRNRKVVVLPEFYSKDNKGNMTAITETAIETAKTAKTENRENAKKVATAKSNLFEELRIKSHKLATCKKLAEFDAVAKDIAETLNAIETL